MDKFEKQAKAAYRNTEKCRLAAKDALKLGTTTLPVFVKTQLDLIEREDSLAGCSYTRLFRIYLDQAKPTADTADDIKNVNTWTERTKKWLN